MTEGPRRIESCWVVSDGRAGMEGQCLGLAEALGIRPTVKRIKTRAPWRWLPPLLWRDPLRAIDRRKGDDLDPPWPDLVIATGRQSVAPALAIRRASRGRALVVQIQHPTVDPRHFDLVVAPAHDRLSGANVIATLGSVHRVTPERLAAAAAAEAPRLARLPRPYVAVMIGGPNRVYRMTPELLRRLGQELKSAIQEIGGSLLVTASRRTGAANEAALREGLAGASAEIWDQQGSNPYFAYLGLADAIVVTCDSVNMLSEAASSGKPVHLVALPGGSAKFRSFHEALETAGVVRPFRGRIESWTYDPLSETARAAEEVRRRLQIAVAG